jgi:AcrR family transcriptional regulator
MAATVEENVHETVQEQRAGRPRDPRLDAAIMDATVALLEERGYAELTLTAVAERANTTTAAIYRRWNSKSDLVGRSVFRTDGDDVVADTGDVATDIATMVGWSVEKICRPAALAALAGLLTESRGERAAWTTEAATASVQVATRVRRAQETGDIRSDIDPVVVSALISGPVLHMAMAGMADQVDKAWIADLVAVVLDGIRSDGVRHVGGIGRRPRKRATTAGKR